MKTKRFNVYCRVPVFIGLMLEERSREHGFRNMAEVTLYIVEHYTRQRHSAPCSKNVLKILDYMPRDRSKIVSMAQRFTLIFKMERERYEEFTRLIVEDGFNSRNEFIISVLEALLIAPPRYSRMLSEEMNEGHVCGVIKEKMEFKTYVSGLQHDVLKQKAKNAELTISGLMRVAMEVFFKVNTPGEPVNLPVDVVDTIKSVMEIKGSTVKRFSREKTVCMTIPGTEDRDRLFDLMLKYKIQGPHEMARRFVLFFLHGDRLVDDREEEPGEEPDRVCLDNLDFERMTRKNFERSIYY